jgi:hypothetical protein
MYQLYVEPFDTRFFTQNRAERRSSGDGTLRKELDNPTTLGPQRPREASPTGKSGVGYTTYSVERQPLEQIQATFIMRDTDPIRGASLTVQGTVDPYASLLGRPNPDADGPFAALGLRWKP